MSLKSSQQLVMQDVKFKLKGRAKFLSESGWIDAQGLNIKAKENPSATDDEIVFQASERLCLDDSEIDAEQKISFVGKDLEARNSKLASKKGLTFNGRHLVGADTQLESEGGSLEMNASKSSASIGSIKAHRKERSRKRRTNGSSSGITKIKPWRSFAGLKSWVLSTRGSMRKKFKTKARIFSVWMIIVPPPKKK